MAKLKVVRAKPKARVSVVTAVPQRKLKVVSKPSKGRNANPQKRHSMTVSSGPITFTNVHGVKTRKPAKAPKTKVKSGPFVFKNANGTQTGSPKRKSSPKKSVKRTPRIKSKKSRVLFF